MSRKRRHRHVAVDVSRCEKQHPLQDLVSRPLRVERKPWRETGCRGPGKSDGRFRVVEKNLDRPGIRLVRRDDRSEHSRPSPKFGHGTSRDNPVTAPETNASVFGVYLPESPDPSGTDSFRPNFAVERIDQGASRNNGKGWSATGPVFPGNLTARAAEVLREFNRIPGIEFRERLTWPGSRHQSRNASGLPAFLVGKCAGCDSAKGFPEHAERGAGRNRFAPGVVAHENELAGSTLHEFQEICQFPGFKKAGVIETGNERRRQQMRFSSHPVDQRGNCPFD